MTITRTTTIDIPSFHGACASLWVEREAGGWPLYSVGSPRNDLSAFLPIPRIGEHLEHHGVIFTVVDVIYGDRGEDGRFIKIVVRGA